MIPSYERQMALGIRSPYPQYDTGATFSPDRVWRYVLWRIWTPGSVCAFIGLNPSTADETQDDPTVRRCIGFAKQWLYGGMFMLNAFALRSTDPNGLREAMDPVGLGNDAWIIAIAKRSDLVVACWGNHGKYRDRQQEVCHILARAGVEMMCFGLTNSGSPKHPLYLPRSSRPRPFSLAQ